MRISNYAVKHPAVIAMFLIALFVFGLFCLQNMSLEFIPDMSLPEVEVITVYTGASAEDVEKDVTRILEDSLVTLPNYKGMKSQSMNSVSWITITYQDGIDVYDQLTELRFRLQELEKDLPEDAQKPYALVGGATMLPIMQFAIKGGDDIARITDYLNNTLKPRLTRIDGVAEVSMFGDATPHVNVKLRMEDVASRGVSILQVYQVLNYSNFTVPLGTAEYQGHVINAKYDGTVEDLDQVRDLPVGMGTDNVMVYLRDIADVSYRTPDSNVHVMSEGSDMVMVSVTKRSNANTVRINSEIRRILERLPEETNGALSAEIFADDSKSISESLSNVLNSGVMGIIIAIIVIFLFMNDVRATIVIGSAIPLSFLFAFIAMRLTGNTINLVTTSAFVVSLGMVVDASTVMLEQIMRYMGKGNYSSDEAIMLGANEVGSSIIASAMTTIVVFIPIIFLKGMVGMILNGFAAVLVMCISASLLVSVVVVPFLMKVLMGKRQRKPGRTLFMRGIDKLEGSYSKSLRWALINRRYVIIIPTVLLLMSMTLILNLGYSFIPSIDTGEYYVNLTMPQSYTMDHSKEKAQEAAELLRNMQGDDISGIAVFVGMGDSVASSVLPRANDSYLYVKLRSGKDRHDVHDLINQAQYELSAQIPDCTVVVTNGGFDRLVSFISGGGGYKLTLVGTDINQLYREGTRLRAELAKDPDVMTTSLSTDFDRQIMTIDMDQTKMNSLGLTSYEVGMVSAILFNGVDTGHLTMDNGARSSIHLCSDIVDGPVDSYILGSIPIRTLAGSTVTFEELGDIVVGKTVNSISHTERTVSITVGATLVSEDASGVTGRMNAYLDENPLEAGIETKASGIVGLIEDSLLSVVTAVAIAIFLLYMVMVIQFERFKQPLIIMVSVPFCLIGVIVSLLACGSSITLMSVIAVVALAGTVVNNAIILVDYINQIRDRKRSAIILNVDEDQIDAPGGDFTSEAGRGRLLDLATEQRILAMSVVQGGSSRIKPILITTITTVVGVIPMALAIGEGSELYSSVGQAIAGGLATSTLITLFIVPVIYFIGERGGLKRKDRLGRIKPIDLDRIRAEQKGNNVIARRLLELEEKVNRLGEGKKGERNEEK